MTSPASSACNLGSGFSSASASGITGSTANDGTCTICTVGKYKTGSGATACIDMTYKTCAQGREFSSASAGADKEGATSNDGNAPYVPQESISLQQVQDLV